MQSVSFGPTPDAVVKKLGASSIQLTSSNERPDVFARVIAKIAYSSAAAEGILDQIDSDSPVVPSILGRIDDIGRWVGTISGPVEHYPGHLHRILFHRDIDRGLLVGEVHLFSDSQAPRYGVILGKLR